ncbi:uncharacterized protein LOC129315379 isoform X1 [Prosopis cineraria]|uniref:uncharacterized protein LOC129315379 isoform X1 n=1 Tax=Prosopis cineraria TaxID=364024 RepID=UPI00240F6DA9|nr:uncharacterized protein LOC129315379 isoform X1 [Prosopis cineraria]
MDPSSIIWDVTKCLCGCLKNQACYVYDLEENLQSLEETSEKLENMKKDVEELVEEEEHTGEMRRSHQVTAWLQKIDGIQENLVKERTFKLSVPTPPSSTAASDADDPEAFLFLSSSIFPVTHLETEGEREPRIYSDLPSLLLGSSSYECAPESPPPLHCVAVVHCCRSLVEHPAPSSSVFAAA